MLIHSIWARLRALGALACFVTGCALDPSADTEESTENVSQALANDVAVYTNGALASGWKNWSWQTTITLASPIKIVSISASGALALAHSSGDIVASDYDSIGFDVRGASAGTIALKLQSLGGASSGVQASIPVGTTSTHQTVKLSAIQGTLASFGKLDFVATQSGQTFYVDNVKLVAKVAASTASTSFPSSPITVKKGDVVTLTYGAGSYSVYVPNRYDATHKTPTKVLLWLHGCGGNAYGDAWATSGSAGAPDWLAVSVGGRDGGCWDPDADVPLALGALDDVAKHLNVDPHRVIIGGYSSGGDMAYRTAFYAARRFAGVLVENTSPFRDTGSSQSASIAAAAWKLPIVHLAHLNDTTYPIAGVRTETDAVKNAGFPLTRIERAGTHWDPEATSSGTNYDMRTYLLPYIEAGWVSPN